MFLETLGSKPLKSYYPSDETSSCPCPLCGSHEGKLLKVERGTLGIVECQGCTLIRVNPRLAESPIGLEGELSTALSQVTSGKAEYYQDRNYARILNRMEKYQGPGKLLELGSKAGCFLRLAEKRGWNVTGFERSAEQAKFARQAWNLEVLSGDLENHRLPTGFFDFVVSAEGFDSIANPKNFLATARRSLKTSGLLYLRVPNGPAAYLKYRYKRFFAKDNENNFEAHRRLYHYSQTTLTNILKMSGFEIVELFVEAPVTQPAWKDCVGFPYKHSSPWVLSWRSRLKENLLYHVSRAGRKLLGNVGALAPQIGCIARPVGN